MSSQQIAAVLADLHLLTIIAQTRNLTQAARQLAVSKASVSMRLRELERAVGVPLVRRTTRSINLTAAGVQLVDDTQAPFAAIEQSFAGVKDLAGIPRGLVRMTAPVALGRQRIAPTVPQLLLRYPEMRLELDLSDRFVNLVQEGFDVAVRHARDLPESYVAQILCESQSLLVASPQYLQRRGTPEHPLELSRHDSLLYLRDGGAQSWSFERLSARRRGERISVPVTGPFKANNSEVLREALKGGLGVGLLPDFSAREDVGSGRLTQILSDWRPVGFFGERIYALRPPALRAPRAVQCVLEHLRQVFATGPHRKAP
jgi:DNA-binding transcriptional LysR family regulator